MNWYQTIKGMDGKFSWSFLGFIATVFSLLISIGLVIYSNATKETTKPNLTFDITASLNVLDLREGVQGVSILVEGEDILQEGLALRLLTIRVENSSSADILNAFYDERAPLGCFISIGQIVNINLVEASNEYLEKNLEFQTVDENTVHFPHLIIDAGAYFTFSLLILHPDDELPVLFSKGKIAGIESITIDQSFREVTTADEPVLFEAFSGSVLAQLARLLGYFSIGLEPIS